MARIEVRTNSGWPVGLAPMPASPSGSVRRRTRLDAAIFGLSMAGVPIVVFALRRLGRLGGLLLEVAAGVLCVRAVAMLAAGTALRLRVVLRMLLFAEAAVDGLAAGAGFWAWVWRPFVRPALVKHDGVGTRLQRSAQARPRASRIFASSSWVTSVATAAWMAALVVHTARVAIYISPSRGRRNGPAVVP